MKGANYSLKQYAEMIEEDCTSNIERVFCKTCSDSECFVNAKEQIESTLQHLIDSVVEILAKDFKFEIDPSVITQRLDETAVGSLLTTEMESK